MATLDEAWAELEAALPEGWKIQELNSRWGRKAWQAKAAFWRPGPIEEFREATGDGDSPPLALLDLAAKLRSATSSR